MIGYFVQYITFYEVIRYHDIITDTSYGMRRLHIRYIAYDIIIPFFVLCYMLLYEDVI